MSTGHTETASGPREAKAPAIRRTRRPLLTMPSGVQCSRTELDQHTTIDDSVYEQWLSDTETVVRLHSFDLMFCKCCGALIRCAYNHLRPAQKLTWQPNPKKSRKVPSTENGPVAAFLGLHGKEIDEAIFVSPLRISPVLADALRTSPALADARTPCGLDLTWQCAYPGGMDNT